MNDAHIQVYGWINPGGNLSTSTVQPGGNVPAAYMYTPNTVSSIRPWSTWSAFPTRCRPTTSTGAFASPAIYGENYRYTTAYGIASYQLLGTTSSTATTFR